MSTPPLERRFGPYGGPLRARDADPGARRARARVARRARRPRVHGRARRCCCATTSGARRRCTGRARLSEVAGLGGVAQARGHPPHGRAQDQQRDRPGAARQADGQAARDRGDRARASTASRPRPRARCSTSSASSTWAPRTSAASSRTCSGWGCSAPRSSASTPARRTLKEAVSAAIRDWVANVGDDALHHRLGRRPGAVPGARARPAAGDRRRGARADAGAGGAAAGPRDGVRRRRLELDRDVRAVRRRRRGRADRRRGGRRRPRHAPPLGAAHDRASAACCTARCPPCMQDEEGQILEAHSISAGLDYPGSGPEHAYLRDTGRVRYVAVDDRDALARVPARRASWRGSSPRSSPRTRSRGCSRTRGPGRVDLVTLSGRGDKDLTEVLVADRGGRDARERPHRRRVRLARQAGGADAVPDGRVSRRWTSPRAAGEAAVDAGADLIELGIPFSDPLADGPVIHAAAVEALRVGVTPHGVLRVCERLSARVPVVLMVYANVILAAGAAAFALRAAAAGAAGLIVPDLPLRRGRRSCAPPATRRGSRWCRWSRRRRSPERVAEIGADARGFVYTVSLSGTTGERTALPPDLADDSRARARGDRGAGRRRIRDLDRRAGARGRRAGGRRDRRQPHRPRGGRGRRGAVGEAVADLAEASPCASGAISHRMLRLAGRRRGALLRHNSANGAAPGPSVAADLLRHRPAPRRRSARRSSRPRSCRPHRRRGGPARAVASLAARGRAAAGCRCAPPPARS